MARPLRIAYPGAWYHIMNRGLARKDIFLISRHRVMFLDLLAEIHKRYQVEIHAYCLMSNHYHLLLRTPLGNISRVMRHLDGVFTQRFNKSTKRDGPLFRGRYKSILVDADMYLLRLSRYIHLNPVKAKLVKSGEDYRWSSYQYYLSKKRIEWLHIDKTLGYFGDRDKYRMFVEEGIDSELDNFYQNNKRVPILGSKAFIKTMSEKHLEDRYIIKDIPEHKFLKFSSRNTIEVIMQQVAKYYGIEVSDLMIVKKRDVSLPRAIGIYLCQYIGQYSSSEISAAFTNIGTEGVLKSCRKIHAKITENSWLKKEINELENQLMDIKLEVGI